MNKFSNRAIKGICKAGDVYLPQNGEFPKYSDVGGTQFLDMMIENAPPKDIKALNLAMAIISFLPNFMVAWLVNWFASATKSSSNGIIASNLRQLHMGLRGLVYGTYYSELINPNYKGKTPLELLDYSINRVED